VPLGQVTRRYVVCVSPLGILAAKSAHRVTGVATFVLLANIGNQREIAPELTGHGLPLSKCEAYNRVYDQPSESH
jgi:hypothetical protein